MLTTFDNPHDPFEDYAPWLSFDKEHNYDSAERVMRIAQLTDEMTDAEENAEIERAIDEIIKFDVLNVYKKVDKELTLPEE
jgi:hypothetical protein